MCWSVSGSYDLGWTEMQDDGESAIFGFPNLLRKKIILQILALNMGIQA